jgi:hypothetical protein
VMPCILLENHQKFRRKGPPPPSVFHRTAGKVSIRPRGSTIQKTVLLAYLLSIWHFMQLR